MSDGTAAPAAAATRRKLEHTKRTDNFLKSVGEKAVWAMGATALATYLQNSELMTRKPYCEALLEKMRGATGLDLVSTDACLEEHAQPPWVRLQRSHEREKLKEGSVTMGQIAKFRNLLERLGLGYAALLYRSCHRQSPLMDYRFVSPLGQGGFGFVSRVANRNLPDDAPHVALKLIKVKHDDEEAAQEEIEKTAREMSLHQRAAAASQYVVNMHTWGQIAEEYFFVIMDLCEGGDVAKLLYEQPGRGLEAGLLWKFYEQLAEGVQAIHEADLIHLDLKPENCAYIARLRDFFSPHSRALFARSSPRDRRRLARSAHRRPRAREARAGGRRYDDADARRRHARLHGAGGPFGSLRPQGRHVLARGVDV